MSYQNITVCGNLGGDVRFNTYQEQEVANFSLAVNQRWIDRQSGERMESVTWFQVEVWGNQARPCANFLHKGSEVTVYNARIRSELYQPETGPAQAQLRLRAGFVEFHGGADQANGAQGNGSTTVRPARPRPEPVSASNGTQAAAPQDVTEIPFD